MRQCYISGAKDVDVSSSQFEELSVTTTSRTNEAGELQVNFKISVILEVLYKELEIPRWNLNMVMVQGLLIICASKMTFISLSSFFFLMLMHKS